MMKRTAALMLAMALLCGAQGAQAIDFALDDQSEEVSLIQQALLELDFYYGDVTGHYGSRTQRGIRLFQAEYGLEVTGIADDATRERLYAAAGMEQPPVSQTLIETNTTLRRGDSGMAVTWLQESLTELGYYEGEITGSYGLLTHEAVRLYQRGNGLSSDGVAGRNTVRLIAQQLEEKHAADAQAQALWGEGETPAPQQEDQEQITVLSRGVQNSAVRRLQEDLSLLGYYKGTVTGSFGSLTKEAVRLFQRAHDLPSDGVAGPLTLAEIENEMERRFGTPQPLTTAAPQTGWDQFVTYITPAPAATPTPTPAPVRPMITSQVGFLSIERTLELYDSSQDVAQLQTALGALGYYSAAATGYFDLATQQAVMTYQTAKGIAVTGVADKVTLITINDDIFRRIAGEID